MVKRILIFALRMIYRLLVKVDRNLADRGREIFWNLKNAGSTFAEVNRRIDSLEAEVRRLGYEVQREPLIHELPDLFEVVGRHARSQIRIEQQIQEIHKLRDFLKTVNTAQIAEPQRSNADA